MGTDPSRALRGTDVHMTALEKQVLLMRCDLQKARGKIAECRRIIKEKDEEMAGGTSRIAGVVRTDNHLRFAKGRAVSWNVRAPGRFERANRLKVPIPTYGGQQMHGECA